MPDEPGQFSYSKSPSLMKPTLQESYDGFADTYDANRGRFDMGPVFDDFWQRLGGNHGDALDLGCGAGEPFAKNFIERGWGVTGVDFSARMLQLAERYVPEMRRIHADMAKEPHARMISIREELEAIVEPEYWEVSDRGINFDYLSPERRAQLAVFFDWFEHGEWGTEGG